MKISKKRLIEIINEEISEATQPNDDKAVGALAEFSKRLYQLSIEIKKVKGLDVKEMNGILSILEDLIKFSAKNSAGQGITQLDKVVQTKTGAKK